jgi:Ca2+-transporting ATPase
MASNKHPTAFSDWHMQDATTLAQLHQVDPALGLSSEQAKERLGLYGPNALPRHIRRSAVTLLKEQFSDVMVLVLLAAALISGAVGDIVDTLVIMAIVVLNAGFGLVQAWRADNALEAIHALSAIRASVQRDGHIQDIDACDLVPGDIVLLEAGNQVPADIRLVAAIQMKSDESALTGESLTIDKHTDVISSAATALGDKFNMAFKGTAVTHGRARGLVVSTGMATEIGKIAEMLSQTDAVITPLQKRLGFFGKRIAAVVVAICLTIFIVGVLRGEPPLLMVMTALSLAVAAIPEALPAVVTVLLALGARKLVALNALVRHLPAVETLGSVTYICSDKTGTLTQNQMHVEHLIVAVDGHPRSIALPGSLNKAAQEEVLRAAVLCNDARRSQDLRWSGDPTETALTVAADSHGIDKEELDEHNPRVHEVPFDAKRQRMSTLHQTEQGLVSYVKGAPEQVISQCRTIWDPTSGAEGHTLDRAIWLAQAASLASNGLRVLALARRNHDQHPREAHLAHALESDMSLVGLIALIDPPRPQAQGAITECLGAGITPVMITGDHPATALAIASQLGLTQTSKPAVITGPELSALSDAELAARVNDVRVYARVDPAQKIRIVQALQARGEFVAMTGDGVNDAPALKQADIGIAMGKGGTDVAREASGLVLMDDDFATIVKAVREGRRIFDNIRKFIRYAMTGNSGEIWTIFLAPMLALPIPLLPIHILWVNLVTDGLPGLALASEPAEPGLMRRPPRPPQESLFAHGMWQHILGIGLLIAGLCLGVQAWAIAAGHEHWQTMVFTVLTLSQMAHVMAIRSEQLPLWRLGLGSNKPLLCAVLITFALQMAAIYLEPMQVLFKTQALSLTELAICLGAALIVWLAVEVEKAWRQSQA